MKKLILSALLTLSVFFSYSQYRGTRQNAPLVRTEDYVSNSPGSSIANSKLIAYYKDSTAMGYNYPSIEFWNFKANRNDGVPTRVLWLDANGFMKISPMPSFLLTETDPVWNIDKVNYYDKSTSDGRYLQGFTEVDPNVPAYSKTLTGFSVIKTSTDALYRPITYVPAFADITSKPTTLSGYGITDAYPLTGNPSGFLNSYTENDPTVPSYSKLLTAFSVIKSSTDPLYKSVSYVPAWSDITSKPSFATVATSGSYNDLTNKPTIPSAQVQSDWNSVSGVSQILNKPTVNRTEAYAGTTNASGEYTVTFATPFSSTPKVVPSIKTTDNRSNVIVTASSTTGFTVRAVTYNVITVLAIEVIAGAPSPINGATVNVIVSQ